MTGEKGHEQARQSFSVYSMNKCYSIQTRWVAPFCPIYGDGPHGYTCRIDKMSRVASTAKLWKWVHVGVNNQVLTPGFRHLFL